MPSKQNIEQLAQIKEKKGQSKSTIFVDFRGLGVNKLNELRQKVAETGGEMLVAKNTLLTIAYEDGSLKTLLSGPTAAIFATEDEISPLKAVADFAKANELPTFTGGFFEGKVISADEVDRLSKLPGKEELYAKVVGSMAAPLSGMVNVLQGNIRNIVYILNAIREQKGQQQ